MVTRARLKSFLTGVALYTMAAGMVGYFGVNAYTGKYGLNAQQQLDQQIIALTSELARLKQERAVGEQRVSLLRSDRLDPDMLDEQARYQLDYVNPHDLVWMNHPAQDHQTQDHVTQEIPSPDMSMDSKNQSN